MAGFSSSTLFLIFLSLTDAFASESYTNVWAVKFRGNQEEVKRFASKNNLTYDRHVGIALSFLTFRSISRAEISFCIILNLEQLQNTPQLIYMSLNKNSVYCVMPRSSKPPDTCK